MHMAPIATGNASWGGWITATTKIGCSPKFFRTYLHVYIYTSTYIYIYELLTVTNRMRTWVGRNWCNKVVASRLGDICYQQFVPKQQIGWKKVCEMKITQKLIRRNEINDNSNRVWRACAKHLNFNYARTRRSRCVLKWQRRSSGGIREIFERFTEWKEWQLCEIFSCAYVCMCVYILVIIY